ncbi:hypothetical protein KFE25_001539 [Diacronema lutheri]|uniref:Uncharacterized protein n=1 Tax=Diacronema lutheri TaxID=2081491 RepID=A0A8J5X8A5_DIALT|nr:hypothetical protein KFE25_001539 [Diacronema lutheri]
MRTMSSAAGVVRAGTPDSLAVLVGLVAFVLSRQLHARKCHGLAAAITAVLAASHVMDCALAARIGIARLVHELRRRRRRWAVEGDAARRGAFDDECTFIVGPEAIDRNAHMNNARYVRAANVARRALLLRTGIADVLAQDAPRARAEERTPLNLVIVSQVIRYRRELRLCQRYAVRSTIRWWEEPSTLFVEHRFVTRAGTAEQFVNAVQLVRYRLVGLGSRAVAGPDGACAISRLLRLAACRSGRELAACTSAGMLPHGPVAHARAAVCPRDVAMLASFDSESSEMLRAEGAARAAAPATASDK